MMLRLPLLTVNTIALHGEIPTSGEFPAICEHMLGLIGNIGRHVSTVDADSPEDAPAAGPQDFEEWCRRLRLSGFPTDLIRLTLSSNLPLLDLPLVVSSFGALDKGFSFSFDNLVRGFDRQHLEQIARATWSRYPFEYGYAYNCHGEIVRGIMVAVQLGTLRISVVVLPR
jgi:hypothetical protein